MWVRVRVPRTDRAGLRGRSASQWRCRAADPENLWPTSSTRRRLGQARIGRQPLLNAAMRPRPLVLFVDDHADTRELYQLALAYDGFAVMVADSVERAMQCVTDQHPDVIVTDLSISACDGYAFLRWLHGIGEVAI